MRSHSKTALVLLAAFAFVVHARAQALTTVLVETNYPQATVYADTLRLGPAAAGRFSIPVSTQELRLVAEGEKQWSIAPQTVAMDPLAADSVYHVSLPFPYHYQVRSVPFGADVYLLRGGERSLLGKTPLLYTSDSPLAGVLEIEQAGFQAERRTVEEGIWNDFEVLLTPAQGAASTAKVLWNPPRRPRYWIDYAAAGVALAAGVLSVHYKFQADRLYDSPEYQRTGDPEIARRIERLDTRAGVALGAMQAGVGVLAVRLILRR